MRKKQKNTPHPADTAEQIAKNRLNLYLILGFLFLIPVVAISFFVSDAITPNIHKPELSRDGKVATGKVIMRDASSSVHRGGSIESYTIDYTFQPGTSSEITRTDYAISADDYERYQVGSPIEISYLESNPTINAPQSMLHKMNASFYLLMKLIFGFIVPIILLNLIHKYSKKTFKQKSWISVALWLATLAACLAVGMLLGIALTHGLELLLL